MSREEIIEILIKDRIGEWVHAHCSEELEQLLHLGWEGFDKFTNEELEEAIKSLVEENFDDKTAEKIKLEKKRIELQRVKKLKYDINNLVGNVLSELGEKEDEDNNESESDRLPF